MWSNFPKEAVPENRQRISEERLFASSGAPEKTNRSSKQVARAHCTKLPEATAVKNMVVVTNQIVTFFLGHV